MEARGLGSSQLGFSCPSCAGEAAGLIISPGLAMTPWTPHSMGEDWGHCMDLDGTGRL